MIEPAILSLLDGIGAKVSPCGSRVTCNPAPTDTDEDWLVELPWHVQDKKNISMIVTDIFADYEVESGEHYQDQVGTFVSLRKGDVNVLLSASSSWCERHRLATELCRRLNLLRKEDRILVFQTILYDNVNYPEFSK